AAYQRLMDCNDLQAEINLRFQSADSNNIEALYQLSADIQQKIIRSKIPEDLQEMVLESWKIMEARAGRRITVALRSSAVGEDVAESSFAGQYRSELNVSEDTFFEAYKEVVASKYSLPAITYRLNRGFRDEEIPMCVGCLVMVDARSGGVAYSRNPVNIHDESIQINAAWGLPKSVVDGSDACDLMVVSREPGLRVIIEEINRKQRKFVCYPEEGVCRMDLTGDLQDIPAISHKTAEAIAQVAIRLEEHYGIAQDIEWALDEDENLYILQCRPLRLLNPGDSNTRDFKDLPPDETVLVKGGVTASPGAGIGKVFIAQTGQDILSFPEDAVLVVHQALPRWAPLLSRAAAVVSEEGGFAGHLANVAREFGVPALFSIRDATRIFKPGMTVTVDATGRVVYSGKKDVLPAQLKPHKNLMEGSPVYKILKAVSDHIVPLNLLDPDSAEFSPQHCQTFHDITRFIHEKSVQEMFAFGKDHAFAERSSKQLYYQVPMQWWILNLDDGFKEEVDGKYVTLENISSIPMRALWKGFTAIPWDGPPAIDGRGMASVIFQATANRSLNSGIRSKYADRNYFMISRYFCSLSSRLGFHFSTLEAMVSERSPENYISFQFKGGAADFKRRLKRVHFIREILEAVGFHVSVKEDHLVSRIEGREISYMLKRLEVLGYLTLHTRQLDMIMDNPSQVEYYRSKLKRDIDIIFSVSAGYEDLELKPAQV
ncbi:MAG: PEP/pyruvate-binding domain-containing protein, partial [Thermodesulfobacteriota bacterium]